jgi:hypothetical protein
VWRDTCEHPCVSYWSRTRMNTTQDCGTFKKAIVNDADWRLLSVKRVGCWHPIGPRRDTETQRRLFKRLCRVVLALNSYPGRLGLYAGAMCMARRFPTRRAEPESDMGQRSTTMMTTRRTASAVISAPLLLSTPYNRSAAQRSAPPAPLWIHAPKNAHRRHPPGRNPGRGGRRLESRRIRLRVAQQAPACR